ncbi:hypothetical protein B0H17DRAFT_1150807 [Mycena rosella]|uniref:Uncharacterized protein n=1 Tax=Mycena rosella TaxID=1033263 RepID=A0AAD7BQQ6_MYCRO|nr:hypothetical protein B0H17DRAFT_1150807 [Mycena rosella]
MEKSITQTIILQLSTNNELKSHSDSPHHHFNSIVKTLASSTDNDRNSVVKFAAVTTPSPVLGLLLKHQDIVEWGSHVHSIKLKDMITTKKTIWGGGYYQLVYLASANCNLASTSELLAEGKEVGRNKIADWLQSTAADQLPTEMMTEFVPLFNTAFKTHLLDKMKFFALVSSNSWTAGMAAYITDVKLEVSRYIESLVKNGVETEDLNYLEAFPARLNAVLTGQLMAGYPFVPDVASGLFMTMSPMLSLISGWMVPGISYFKTQRTGTREQSTARHMALSETCSILLHLAYFHNFNKPGWIKGPVATQYWLASHSVETPHSSVGTMWVRPHLPEIKAALKKMTAKGQYNMAKDTTLIGTNSMLSWFTAVVAAAKARDPAATMVTTTLRDLQLCLPAIYVDDEAKNFAGAWSSVHSLTWPAYAIATELQEHDLRQGLQSVFQKLFDSLAKDGMCSILILDDKNEPIKMKPHPALEGILLALIQSAEKIQNDVLSVRAQSDNYKMVDWVPAPAPTKFSYKHRNLVVSFATQEDLERFYPEGVEVLGPTELATTKRKRDIVDEDEDEERTKHVKVMEDRDEEEEED